MAGFPILPSINTEIDEDASIHLDASVGPTRPSSMSIKMSKEADIIRILNATTDKDQHLVAEEYNEHFRNFLFNGSFEPKEDDLVYHVQSGNVDKDELNNHNYNDDHSRLNYKKEQDIDSEDNTEVEEEQDNYLTKHKNNETHFKHNYDSPSATKSTLIYFSIALCSFLITLALVSTRLNKNASQSNPFSTPQNYDHFLSKFKQTDKRIEKLSELNTALNRRQDFLQQTTDSLENTIHQKFESLSLRLKESRGNVSESHLSVLAQDIAKLKKSVRNMRLDDSIETKLLEVNEKLKALYNLNANIENIKEEILKSLKRSLPDHVPIYIKDGKVHFIPEFSRFLNAFLENYFKKSPGGHLANNTTGFNLENALAENEPIIKKLIASFANKNFVEWLAKGSIEKVLEKKIFDNNKLIWEKFNALVDEVNFMSPNSTTVISLTNTSDIQLDGLLEVLSKGSQKVNYADYSLGARILGFLTSGNNDQKPLFKKVLFGWYDYLVLSALSSPDTWKYNANNALLDNSETWECSSTDCSLGIRFFQSIVLTDIVLKTPSLDSDYTVAVYVKPRCLEQYLSLENLFKSLKANFEDTSSNKYLKKFIKIKEVKFSSHQMYNHIQIPKSVVTLRIGVRDLYISLKSSSGKVELINLKAYGVSESDSYKYEREFTGLVHDATTSDVQKEESHEAPFGHYDDRILGEDELLN